MPTPLDIVLQDSLFDPDAEAREAVYRGEPDKPSYRVFLYLSGRDLAFVDRVTYHLHPSFRRSEVSVERSSRNRHCKLTLWTWGLFTVHADVCTLDGARLHLRHAMSYDRDIQPSTAFRAA